MTIDDGFYKLRPRQPSYRGLLQVYVRDGQIVIARWPKKRGKSKNPKVRESQEWFRQAQWATKYWPASIQHQCAEAVKGTPLMPRDLMTMIMAGRAWCWVDEQGRKVYSVAALKDVSDSLDIISQVPGSMLYRSDTLWQVIAPGSPGQVLTSAGADAPPLWAPTGGSGGQTLVPLDNIDITISSANFSSPALATVPALATSADQITGIVWPARSAAAGLRVIPVIYGGSDPFTGTPPLAGAPLLASGPAVAVTVANRLYNCPLTVPFVPTAGRWYWVGFCVYGVAGNIQLAALGANRRQNFAAGTYNPPPAVLPAMTTGTNNNAGWWTY